MNTTEILVLRTRITRLGERDLFHWWESDACTATGEYVFDHLLPRTGRWAAIQVAVSSARARHAAYLPKIPTIHLFDLGAEVERQLADYFYRLKIENGDVSQFRPEVPAGARESVIKALEAFGIQPERHEPRDRTVCLGGVASVELKNPDRLVTRLAAAYGCSRQGHLVVPYFRLVDAR